MSPMQGNEAQLQSTFLLHICSFNILEAVYLWLFLLNALTTSLILAEVLMRPDYPKWGYSYNRLTLGQFPLGYSSNPLILTRDKTIIEINIPTVDFVTPSIWWPTSWDKCWL